MPGSTMSDWVLVPREPTDAMKDAMAKACGGCSFGYFDRETNTYETDREMAQSIYDAMLAAAPSGVRVDDATESHPVIVANRIAQARAFEAVCDLLNKVLPGWCDTDALGGFEQMACDAIHFLSERRGRWHFASIDLAPDLLHLLGIKNAIGANPEGQSFFEKEAAEMASKMLNEFQVQWGVPAK